MGMGNCMTLGLARGIKGQYFLEGKLRNSDGVCMPVVQVARQCLGPRRGFSVCGPVVQGEVVAPSRVAEARAGGIIATGQRAHLQSDDDGTPGFLF